MNDGGFRFSRTVNPAWVGLDKQANNLVSPSSDRSRASCWRRLCGRGLSIHAFLDRTYPTSSVNYDHPDFYIILLGDGIQSWVERSSSFKMTSVAGDSGFPLATFEHIRARRTRGRAFVEHPT